MEHNLEYKNPPKFATYKARHEKDYQTTCCISKDQFEIISARACAYCGVEGSNGIDRIDPKQGYLLKNCNPCCKHCNYVKGNLSQADFRQWTKRFVEFQLRAMEKKPK